MTPQPRQSSRRPTVAQRRELERLAASPRGTLLYDPHYVYPRRHYEALSELGLVTIWPAGAFEDLVKITAAGREGV